MACKFLLHAELVLFYFDVAIYKTIEERKEAERIAQKIFPNTIAATEGLELKL